MGSVVLTLLVLYPSVAFYLWFVHTPVLSLSQIVMCHEKTKYLLRSEVNSGWHVLSIVMATSYGYFKSLILVCLENGGSALQQNVPHVSAYMVSCPKRPESSICPV